LHSGGNLIEKLSIDFLMGGSSSIPKPDNSESDKQLELEQEQLDLAKQQTADAEEAAKAAANAPKPLPPPPPPTQDSMDLVQAQEQARIQAARRVNTGRNTLFADSPSASLGGSSTLLGY
jgi:hypothetical protein